MHRMSSLARMTAVVVAAVAIFCVCFAGSAEADKEIPKTRLSQNSHHLPTGGPTLTVLYWYAPTSMRLTTSRILIRFCLPLATPRKMLSYQCGYRKAFEDYSNILSQNYPQLVIIGDNYNPQNFQFYLSKLITFLKFAMIACIFSAWDLWGYIGQPQPAWFTWCQTNKLYACMMFFFVGNMLEGQLISSGAFEILLNDIPIWSKIETGRVPSPQELFQILDGYLKLENKVPDFDV